MDLDKEFVRSILNEGESAYKAAVDKGITPDILFDEGKKGWEFVLKHRKEYGQLPSKEVVISSIFDAKGDPLDLSAGLMDKSIVLIDRLLDRRSLNLITDGLRQITEHCTQRDAKGAAEAFTEIHRKMLKERVTVAKVESMFALGQEVLDHYARVKSGIRGLPTPWETMDRQTMGWWPEDLNLIIGRMGMGKTFMLLLIAHAAWMPGKRVLICTTEMSRVALAQRFMCMHLRIPYGAYRSATLGAYGEKQLEEGVRALMSEKGISMVGDDFDFSIESLDSAVEDDQPDMLLVDGAYLIKNSGKDRHERVSNTFDDLKRIGKLRKISVTTSTQFNRQAKSGQEDSLSADNIGITDVAGWNATNAFGLFQTQEMYDKRIMGIKPLKIREGRPELLHVQWDLDKMKFGEVSVDGSEPIVAGLPAPDVGDSDDMPDIPF